MAISKTKKQGVVATIARAVEDAASVVFVSFSGISVADTTTMRKELRDEGVGYYVAKKSLIRHVLDARGYTGELPELPGEIAIVWSASDATLPARSMYEQGKKYKDTLTIVGGVFENAYVDAAKMQSIATIPPLPVLRGMFVNVINSPIQGLVIALDHIRQSKAAA
ncbi:MAG: 50S ribosomal protein L10 [Parcubacteria group bacterium 21-54-25]|nr:MAG: 50S ribosomal protein L10 [Parcubacteria group bacterium 21-54-25]HQU07496.1 50S ribosomal protein L10 [Candidatus Paceibacterota bacterium]